MQIIDVEMESGRLFCPVNGRIICDPQGETIPSPATKVLFLHDIGDFDFVTKDLECLLEQARADVDAAEESSDENSPQNVFMHVLALANAAKAQSNLAVFVITTSGFACGPVSSTFAIGIDMAHEEEV